MSSTTLHPVAKQMNLLREELADEFKERRRQIEAATLAMLVGEHVFWVGPPGTGKTTLAKVLLNAIRGSRYFEILLSKTRPSESVLGQYDIPRLREHGDLVRKVKGYLPDCEFALLDELGKMSPTTGHDLLSILLQRELHQVESAGRSVIPCPLSTVIAGSNELPTEESEDAAALWDRILVRDVIDEIQESSNFAAMLVGDITPAANTIEWTDLKDVIDNVIPKITIPQDVIEMILLLREAMREKDLQASSRRWKQSMKLLKASAFMAGRTEVSVDDIQVLRHSLWELPSQIQTVERLTLMVSNPIAEKALEQLDLAEEIAQAVRDAKGLARDKRSELGTELTSRLHVIASSLADIRAEAVSKGASTTKLDEVSDRVQAITASVYTDVMKLDLNVVRAAVGS